MGKKKIDMSDPEWQIKSAFGDSETGINNISFKSQFEGDFEKQLRKMEMEELHKINQESYLKRVFEIIYMKYSEAILDLNNAIMLKEEAPKDFRAGFQNALVASLKIFLNVKNEMVNK